MAGIINIIYKKQRQLGLSGDVSLAVGSGRFYKQRDDLPTELGSFSSNPKIIPSLNLNYNTEAIRSFVQGEVLFQDDLPNNEFTTRFYEDGRVIESQVRENRDQVHYITRLGSDWNIDDANTVSLSGVYDFETHTDRAEVPFIVAATGERERFWFWKENEDTGFANISVDLTHQFKTPGHELGVNLQYTRGWEDESYFLNEVSSVREGTDMTRLEAEENTLPLSIDYIRPLRTGRMELGARIQRRWLPITYTVNRGMQSVIYEVLAISPTGTRTSMPCTPTWSVRRVTTRSRVGCALSRPTSPTRFRTRTSTTTAVTRTTTSRCFPTSSLPTG